MQIMPENYVTQINMIVESELTEKGWDNETVIEYQFAFFPAIDGVPIETEDKNVIIVSVNDNGIVGMHYNWVELTQD